MRLSKTPEPIKRLLMPLYKKWLNPSQTYPSDPRWVTVKRKLAESKRTIDLGCGNNPVEGATVGVDLYVDPVQRSLGSGPTINISKFEERGITFVNSRIDSILPFADKEFDFAYSHHAFEHLEDPATACNEIMRIARSGVIITPSILAELIFGRSYHRWLVMDRGDTLLFFRKRPFEDRPFGEHPRRDDRKKTWVVEKGTNPFDILLNDGNWYQGNEKLPRLADILRKCWYSHSPLMEVIFLWDEKFDYGIYESSRD